MPKYIVEGTAMPGNNVALEALLDEAEKLTRETFFEHGRVAPAIIFEPAGGVRLFIPLVDELTAIMPRENALEYGVALRGEDAIGFVVMSEVTAFTREGESPEETRADGVSLEGHWEDGSWSRRLFYIDRKDDNPATLRPIAAGTIDSEAPSAFQESVWEGLLTEPEKATTH